MEYLGKRDNRVIHSTHGQFEARDDQGGWRLLQDETGQTRSKLGDAHILRRRCGRKHCSVRDPPETYASSPSETSEEQSQRELNPTSMAKSNAATRGESHNSSNLAIGPPEGFRRRPFNKKVNKSQKEEITTTQTDPKTVEKAGVLGLLTGASNQSPSHENASDLDHSQCSSSGMTELDRRTTGKCRPYHRAGGQSESRGHEIVRRQVPEQEEQKSPKLQSQAPHPHRPELGKITPLLPGPRLTSIDPNAEEKPTRLIPDKPVSDEGFRRQIFRSNMGLHSSKEVDSTLEPDSSYSNQHTLKPITYSGPNQELWHGLHYHQDATGRLRGHIEPSGHRALPQQRAYNEFEPDYEAPVLRLADRIKTKGSPVRTQADRMEIHHDPFKTLQNTLRPPLDQIVRNEGGVSYTRREALHRQKLTNAVIDVALARKDPEKELKAKNELFDLGNARFDSIPYGQSDFGKRTRRPS